MPQLNHQLIPALGPDSRLPAPNALVDWPPNAIGSPQANKQRIAKGGTPLHRVGLRRQESLARATP